MTRTNRLGIFLALFLLGTFIPCSLQGSMMSATISPGSSGGFFDSGGSYFSDFLGGDGTLPTRAEALNSIPLIQDWVYYDPSGTGPYNPGIQPEFESKVGGMAEFSLDSGPVTPGSRNVRGRISDSGRVGFALDGNWDFRATIPPGESTLTLLLKDDGNDGAGSIKFPGVPPLDIPAVIRNGDDSSSDTFAYEIEILNDSGAAQILEFNWSGSDVRFGAAVLQMVPEPTAFSVLLLGSVAIAGRRWIGR